jgi:AhpD family alkylhydroperoxidase
VERDVERLRRTLDTLILGLSRELPAHVGAFVRLQGAATEDGALPARVKHLMALAIAICTHCEGCIAYHVRDALTAAASREEVVEAIGVALMMGGGPGLVYGAEAFAALEQLTAAGDGRAA